MRKQQMRHRLPWPACVCSVRGYCRATDTPSSNLALKILSQHGFLNFSFTEFTLYFTIVFWFYTSNVFFLINNISNIIHPVKHPV